MRVLNGKLEIELTKEERDKVKSFYDFYTDLTNLIIKESAFCIDDDDMGHLVCCILGEEEDSEIDFITEERKR